MLYPNDATEYGKELRLKQQFFFVSASLQVFAPVGLPLLPGALSWLPVEAPPCSCRCLLFQGLLL